MTVCSTASASASARLMLSAAKRQRDGEFIAAEAARCTASVPSSSAKATGKRLQEPVAGLIAVLVVDRLEAVDLEGNDDQIVAALPGLRAQSCAARSAKPLRL